MNIHEWCVDTSTCKTNISTLAKRALLLSSECHGSSMNCFVFISFPYSLLFFSSVENREVTLTREKHTHSNRFPLHSEKRTRTLHYGYLRYLDLGMTNVIYQFSMNCWERHFRSLCVCSVCTICENNSYHNINNIKYIKIQN